MKTKGKMYNLEHKVTFLELLSQIPNNNFDWYLFEIDAIGFAPRGISMSEFESLVLEAKQGYKISWLELLRLAENISDLNNLILVSTTIPIDFDMIEKRPCSLKIRLEVYDSCYWELEFYELIL